MPAHYIQELLCKSTRTLLEREEAVFTPFNLNELANVGKLEWDNSRNYDFNTLIFKRGLFHFT